MECLAGRIGVPACSLAAKKAASHKHQASLYRRGRLYAQAYDYPYETRYSFDFFLPRADGLLSKTPMALFLATESHKKKRPFIAT